MHILWKWPIICCSYNQIHLIWPHWEKYSITSSTIALSAFTDLFGLLKLVFGHYSCFQKTKNENKLLMLLKYFEHFNSEYQSIIFLLTRIKIYYIMSSYLLSYVFFLIISCQAKPLRWKKLLKLCICFIINRENIYLCKL